MACGQLIEAGAALAAGKRVFVVSDYQWTFANHPRCRVFATLEDAIAAIMAGAQGACVTSIPRTERRRRLRPAIDNNQGRDRSGAPNLQE